MAEIFNRPENAFGGSFSADGAKIVFATGGAGGAAGGASGGVGLLTQTIQVGYQQQVSRIYEVGTNDVFYVRGRSQGMFSLGRIVGPRPVQSQFYKNYGDVCAAANNNINFEAIAGCNSPDGGAENFTMTNCVLTSISLSTAAQDMIINEQVQGMYNSLDQS